MIRILQINIGVCKAAQDLAIATANDLEVDVLIISEQHRNSGEDRGWYPDTSSRAAIATISNIPVDRVGPPSPGFRWLETNGYRIYSCYCSPNVSLNEFEAFLDGLETSIRGATCPVIVAGDLNAKSPEWGSPIEDRRGRILADLLASTGLSVCNQGNQPTFVRGTSKSHLDLTLVTQAAASNVTGWEVLEEESLSLHRYIRFEVAGGRGNHGNNTKKHWAYRKIDYPRLSEKIKEGAPALPDDAPSACNVAATWLTESCDACMPRSSGNIKRRPVHWWNPEIAEQRKACIKARRIYTRKMKKAGEAGSAIERQQFKEQRKQLTVKILESKESHWRNLCSQIDRDPWGLPYKIVMKRLVRRRQIEGLELPGRLDTIIDTLFPDRNNTARPPTVIQDEDETGRVTTAEIKSVATSIPNGKAPGPDGVPNEVLRLAAVTHPEFFATLYNRCLRSGHFPTQWKKARLVLLPKPGKPLDDPSAYRPLCMLDSVGKLFEKLIVHRLRMHMGETGQQADNQYGFKPGKSTIDAMARLQAVIRDANSRRNARKYVGMLTLDVKNAFNSAPWDAINQKLEATEEPKYLRNIIGDYLYNRQIKFEKTDGSTIAKNVSCGVPQGSVLGPDLWNLLYDDLLKLRLPQDTELIAFADDVAVITTGVVPFQLEERLGIALRDVIDWMTAHGLELALHKTEAIVFTNKNKRNTMRVDYLQHAFPSSRWVKYLGVCFDPRLNFQEHATQAAKRAMEAGRCLMQILPNLRGAKQRTRRVLASVVTSRLLYGAPIWSESMTAKGLGIMESAYRRIMLRVACCYRTTSYAAAAVVASMPPLALLAEERTAIYNGAEKKAVREEILRKWQNSWASPSEKGRWTFRLIKDVRTWFRRTHGEVSFHLSQVLTNHGCFNEYLHKYGKRETNECAHCGATPDSAEHAVFLCDAWYHWRREACVYLEVDQLTPDNIIDTMLESKNK